eukprot:767599-Hanusia_phi.AAC.3
MKGCFLRLTAHCSMFQLLRNFQSLSYIGGEGVDGGQGVCTWNSGFLSADTNLSGAADIIFGDYDNSERLGVSSGLADEENRDLWTGNIYVSRGASRRGGVDSFAAGPLNFDAPELRYVLNVVVE